MIPTEFVNPINTKKGMIERVRAQIRDYAELNRLLCYEKESSDIFIGEAIESALRDYNYSPPLIGRKTIKNFPDHNLLITGAIFFLLKGIGMLITRNSLAYNDGGINVNLDKTAEYQSWLSIYSNEWEQKKSRLKSALNIASMLRV